MASPAPARCGGPFPPPSLGALPPTHCASGQAGARLQGASSGPPVVTGWLVGPVWRVEPTALPRSDSDPSDNFYVATMVITACTPLGPPRAGGGHCRWRGQSLFLTSQLSAQRAEARQAPAVAAALLSYWLAHRAPSPPSKRPLASNCPPATVSGPAQPLVGVPVGPAHCRLVYIKARIQTWRGDGLTR